MAYLVTGGMGCIGAWAIKHLVQRGKTVVNFDISEDRSRLGLLLSPGEQQQVTFLRGDLTDFQQVKSAMEIHGVRFVIHLAALQIPFCKADPVLGCRVNVNGTVNIFEAAHQLGLGHIAFASSIAVFGPAEAYPPGLLANDAPRLPQTLYGVFKVANEETGRIYWQDNGLSSTALRPYTVYGVGRDQGLTSEPSQALAAAVRGEDAAITFGGRMQFQLASDVARQFILAAEQPLGGAYSFNLGGEPAAVQDFADIVMQQRPGIRISVEEKPLPFTEGLDGAGLQAAFGQVYDTPLADGIAQSLALFEEIQGR